MRRSRLVHSDGRLRALLTDDLERRVDRLLRDGVLTVSDCLDDAFAVVRVPGRNDVVLVRARARTLAVKRFPTCERAQCERAQLARLTRCDLRHFTVPEVVLRQGRTLVTASAPALVPLTRRIGRRAAWAGAASALGAALAELHAGPCPSGPRVRPFNPLAVGHEVLGDSPAVRRVIRALQGEEQLGAALAELAGSLEADPPVAVHGDVRAANLLAPPRSSRLTIIDWETSGAGSPWLDVGAGVAMILEWSVVGQIGEPAREAVAAVLAAYGAVDLRLVMQCAGLRLLQTAVEYGEDSVDVPVAASRFDRLGRLLLTRPEEAAIRLGLVR